ncbi:hypothetical protein DOTSEDRAFT_76458 [Dothistroma septosporum NZE10]|uniref:Uncharacterized protein n=1 Tax=Dothistroma septosporum (strain NZE10 / CBS 128990) TaxID=675120 RepID=N1Q3J0_DOTSN|nr:hypothetical protein DOTSEDRAFT_76458 [Dothistroma septosporum NZE10]
MPAPLPPSFSQSKKWVSPNLVGSKQQERANAARQRLCRNSIAWTLNLNREQHRQDFERDWHERKGKQERRELQKQRSRRAVREMYGVSVSIAPQPSSLLVDKLAAVLMRRHEELMPAFCNNLSLVLCRPTVFSHGHSIKRFDPDYELGSVPKPEAEFPGLAEMKYEGDERIATDLLHRRFMGAPRVHGNDTFNWAQAAIIPQYPLDDTRLNYQYAVHRLPNAHESIIVEETMFRAQEWDGRPCSGEPAITDEGVYLLDADLVAYLDD